MEGVCIVVGDAFPVEPKVTAVASFIQKLCKEKIYELVKGVLVAADIIPMLKSLLGLSVCG